MKILASDLDGTLVFKDREETINKKDIKAIQSFQKKGNLFGVCTGRAVNRCKDIQSVIDCDFIIGTSGAHIVDINGNTIYEVTIPFDIVKCIYEEMKNQSVFICLQANGNGYFSKDVFGFTASLLNIDDFKDTSIYGISITFETSELANKMNVYLTNKYKNVHGHQNNCSIDINHCDCSKGNAVKKLKDIYHASCLMAIGDSYNDISMIQAADIGYTFHSSNEDIKREADILVDHLYEAIE